MLTGIVKEAGAPQHIIRMLGEIYQHTPAVLTLHGRDLPIRPTRGMKEGCPLSPTLFLLYYDILLRETKERCPGAHLYVFVDDIAVRAPTKETLLHTLDTLHEVAYTMGLRFNKDKIEVYHWAKDYNLEPITWQHQLINTVSCSPSVPVGTTCSVTAVDDGQTLCRCQRTSSCIARRSAATFLHPHTTSHDCV